ncbi:MAG: hypothetical protein U0075_26445, partial [Thermomicrobiales bacterium]
MDHESFDVLARTVMTNLGTRRGALRVLAGGVFGGVAAHLGLDEQAAAKVKRHGRRPAGHKPDGQAQAAGKKHKRKHKRNERNKPAPPSSCGPGFRPCSNGSCVADKPGVCCLDEEFCPGGRCRASNECCQGDRLCSGTTTCVGPNECCPAEKKCGDGNCYPQDSCCPEETNCGGGLCLAP